MCHPPKSSHQSDDLPSMEARGAKSWEMGSAARLVAIFLGPSLFLNTVAYTPIFISANIYPKCHCLLYFLSPAQGSKASPKKTKKTEFYFLDPESWGDLKKQPACCTPIFQSFLSGTDEGNSSNQLWSPKRHT